ncbi:protein BCCIP [Apis mellifera caucasica]|uniref:Protein BCCIP homolog n=1 Tax=Apis mellifera TaxID=7460 RepID=A0A7M7LN92_APIME|nr:protein BCCIP homolog [Apis mellifera]KAG6797253.1 protein BCCIP [Apis mellifera caucasica]KAG9437802.1 protein BCCIP [Apis mellifera carnica]|eukprot:XP_003251623.1 protein BCCIP homolog [Apis mellifera]
MIMAAPVKKRDVQRNFEDRSSDDDDHNSSNSEDNEKESLEEQGMEIQVDFEGRNPLDPDYHGIKTLLQQLFLKAHIDLGGLTDLIISQNYVGSVVKQSEDLNESDDEDSDINDVFGITTVINLSSGQNYPCIQQLRDLLRQLANEHATDAANTMIKDVLENDSEALGLLINERFVNIPAQISVPLLENLISEIKRANNKKMPFNFSYYILICKLYKTEDKKLEKKLKHKKKDNTEEPAILWSNPEEEIFAEEATISFEFSVEKESDSGLSGTWTETDDEMIPYRRVLLFEATKLQPIIDKIKNHIS